MQRFAPAQRPVAEAGRNAWPLGESDQPPPRAQTSGAAIMEPHAVHHTPPSTFSTADGRPGRERLSGGAADDRLAGSDAGERMRGHLGDDLLIGDLGNDTLVGGAGDDIFAFGRHGVFDVIQDFSQVAGNRDLILIESDAIDAFEDLTIHYSDGDAVFSYATLGALREIVIVRGVGDGGLSAADFLFGPIG